MAHDWKKEGIRVLTNREVGNLYMDGKLDGYYKLYPNGEKNKISGTTPAEILRHYGNGGEFGCSIAELKLLDGTIMHAPEEIDVSAPGIFDGLEYSLWETIKEYLELFGIQLENGNEPDWATVKAVQDKLLDILKDCGVKFKF